MNARENFLALINKKTPDALVNGWELFGSVFDPLMAMTLVAQPGKSVVDPWGVTIYWGEKESGAMPIVTEENKACKDITCWQDSVKAPDIVNASLDWSDTMKQADSIHAENKLTMSLMATGLFEMCHYLMGFEDSLMNLLLEPDSMHELLDYLTEYKLNYAKILVENLHPDVVLFHDDWGSKTSLFIQPDTWREFFKPRYEQIYKYFKDNNVIVMHHSDSFCEPLVPDMIDVGIDIWQGVLPQNDICMLQEQYGGKIVFMGGIDAQIIDVENWTEDLVRTEVRRACDTYTPGGSFIPCLTYGGEGSIFPGVNDVIMGLLVDRFGIKPMVLLGYVIAAVGFILRLPTADYSMIFAAMVLTGVGCTVLNGNLSKIAASLYPVDKIGKMIGILMAGSTASMAVAYGTTALFPNLETAFWITAIVGAIIAAAWLFFTHKEDFHTEQANESVPVKEALNASLKNKNV